MTCCQETRQTASLIINKRLLTRTLLLLTRLLLVDGLTSSTSLASDTPTTHHLTTHTSTSPFSNTLSKVSLDTGESALRQVQWLGSRVAEKEDYYKKQQNVTMPPRPRPAAKIKVDGIGGSAISDQKRQILDYQASMAQQKSALIPLGRKNPKTAKKEQQVWEALANLEQDMQVLDDLAGRQSQLSTLEFTLLAGAVLSVAGGPLLLGGNIAEFLAPTAAAFTAAIGIGAEYTGKVAVADGKEVASAAIQCAAEAEGFLAQAERAKAVTPLCVGIGTLAATLALLVPVLMESLHVNMQMVVTQIYLFCPLIAILAAAVASLAYRETDSYCRQAIGVGNRRFARSGLVGRSWLSSAEQIERKSSSAASKWKSFSWTMIPAPLIGALVPGALPTKTIVTAALAAAQSAYFLAQAENALSRATDAVALKARSAAVCDTYANQGARSAAILPFTSALSGLCAAATAAVVELPFLETLASAGTAGGLAAQIVAFSTFPALSALFAAAASVSKARCQVDAEAAIQAATTLALPYDDEDKDPVLRPLAGVRELVRLTITTMVREPLRRFGRKLNLRRRFRVVKKWFQRLERNRRNKQ